MVIMSYRIALFRMTFNDLQYHSRQTFSYTICSYSCAVVDEISTDIGLAYRAVPLR